MNVGSRPTPPESIERKDCVRNCDSKKLFDTEFEAEVAASKSGHSWDAVMVAYRCGNHWHIGNEDVSLRSKNRTFEPMYCKTCRVYMKKGRWTKHIATQGHRAKKEKEPSED